MTINHLEMLEKALQKSHWKVRRKFPSDELRIAEYWEVCQPNGDSRFNLAFESFDDLESLPVENAYNCYVTENPNLSRYFGKLSKSFGNELAKFITAITESYT